MEQTKSPYCPESVLVKGIVIPIKYLKHPSESPAANVFQGGKSVHIFNMKKKDNVGKATTEKKWWAATQCYANTVVEGLEDILLHGIATLKIDGSNGYVFEMPDDKGNTQLILYRRQDPRLTKEGERKEKEGKELEKSDFVFIEGGIYCQEKPHHTHFPVQRPLTSKDKWEVLAYQRARDAGKLCKGSVEIVGRKFQKNADNYDVDAGLVYHGMVVFEIPKELRTFEGMYEFFKEVNMEGLVFYHQGKVVKIRRDAFEDSDTKEQWEFPDRTKPVLSAPLWI